MAQRPEIALGDWIKVAGLDAVVSMILPPGDPAGDCEVVFHPGMPANLQVRWTGKAWKIANRGDYGGAAEKHARLTEYVSILKAGRGQTDKTSDMFDHIIGEMDRNVAFPPCRVCGVAMGLFLATPSADTSKEERIFKCPKCGMIETNIIEIK
jgi:hypothetical protein